MGAFWGELSPFWVISGLRLGPFCVPLQFGVVWGRFVPVLGWGLSLGLFWSSVFGSFWGRFRTLTVSFWGCVFGVVLEPFWGHFGVVLKLNFGVISGIILGHFGTF